MKVTHLYPRYDTNDFAQDRQWQLQSLGCRAPSYKHFLPKFYAMLIFEHFDWLMIFNIQSECVAKIYAKISLGLGPGFGSYNGTNSCT